MLETPPVDPEVQAVARDWDGETVIARRDVATGTWVFIAIHSSRLGMPVGGTRMHHYAALSDALRDAQRLAEGMTHKWACLGVRKGGGKAVLAIPGPLSPASRRGLLERYGTLLESLKGAFGTGEDLGTTPADMAVIASRTRYVHGVEGDGSVADPGPFTARGVWHGIRVAVRHTLGASTLEGVRILVQGLGDVGGPLARELAASGARLLVADVDAARAATLAEEIGGELVAPEAALATPCDVLAPCAVGGVLDPVTIPRLACRLVAGSANNQLASEADAARLHERGIVYVPDYVINAGGALAFALHGDGLGDHDELLERMERVGETVSEILAEAAARDETPLAAAHRRVERMLAAG